MSGQPVNYAAPHEAPRLSSAIMQAIEQANSWRNPGPPDFLAAVKEVVIIASSSRGGSSIFAEILRRSPELLHFKAEINPFLVLAGLAYPESGVLSDQLGEAEAGSRFQAKLELLSREMALDAGVPSTAGAAGLSDPEAQRRFAGELLWRLVVQWPSVRFEAEIILSLLRETLSALPQSQGAPGNGSKDFQRFHVLFLGAVAGRYPQVNPYYYDVNPQLIAEYFPSIQARQGPPSSHLIEESPFVAVGPWTPATPDMLASRPLVIKTPSNVYRLPFLRRLFPHARFRILHLIRNPGAAINGLYDGWQYNGFYSHRAPAPLAIKGYSDVFPEWGARWWKFDLPPGWESWTTRELEFVCGFQWVSAHQAVLDFQERSHIDYLRIRFEDVIGPHEQRQECFGAIARWLGIDAGALIEAACSELPPVMATCWPRQRRWFQKIQLLAPVLSHPIVKEMAEKLGYEATPESWR